MPLGALLGWGGVEGQSFSPLDASLGALPTKTSSKSEGSASKLLCKMFFLMDRELLMETGTKNTSTKENNGFKQDNNLLFY